MAVSRSVFRRANWSRGRPAGRLAKVGGFYFWLGAGQDAAWGRPQFELDVEAGIPEGFSLGTLGGGHFIVRSPSFVCPPSGGPSRLLGGREPLGRGRAG